MNIVIRTDASVEIGTGHVMRCLALADALRSKGAIISFICRELHGSLCDFLAARGYVVHRLDGLNSANKGSIFQKTPHSHWLSVNWNADAEQTEAILAKEKDVEWLIVDHYALDSEWESRMRQYAHKIMVIDDLADRPHACDLLLDQNLYLDLESRYDGLVPIHCQKLLGPKFVLLRPEFLEARKNLRIRDGLVKRILIFFGGVDPANETAKVVEAIKLIDRTDIGVNVVVGANNPHKGQIQSLCSELSNVNYHCQVSNMAELMTTADLAIGAGGTTSWERCCLGLPSLVTTLAINQEATIEAMADECHLLYLGKSANTTTTMFSKYIYVAISNHYLLRSISKKNLSLVDGRGYERIIKHLMPATIELRLATKADCKNIYLWRNTEESRKVSFVSASINWEEHTKWFETTLNDPNKVLLIGEIEGEPIGVIRYDIDNEIARISVYLVPEKYGRGHGPKLIENGNRWLLQEQPKIKTVYAEILKTNMASTKAFIEAGFEEYTNILRKSFN